MNTLKRLPSRLADASAYIVDGAFRVFLTLLLIRSMINNHLDRSTK